MQLFCECEEKVVYLTGAAEAREISRSVYGDEPSGLSELARESSARIRAAASRGDLECEIQTQPGLDWELADLLSQCGFNVRRARRGVVSVSWA